MWHLRADDDGVLCTCVQLTHCAGMAMAMECGSRWCLVMVLEPAGRVRSAGEPLSRWSVPVAVPRLRAYRANVM